MTTTPTPKTTPAHLAPAACYVCGHSEHTDTTATGGHRYWSNQAADRELRAEAARVSRPGYAEARYVEQTRAR